MNKKKALSFIIIITFLIYSLSYSNISTAKDNTADIIFISSADKLAKIGIDSSYPLDGNYKLTADIDLSNMTWTPIGGYYGEKGRVSGAGVFTGTFDGQGHVIKGLTINYSGSLPNSSLYAELGLFGVIGSGDANDYAIVKNIIFTDVDIRAEFTNALCSAGTLAGDVNGYSKIQNIAVLNGSLYINTKEGCDTVGAGGIIGECRTDPSKLSAGNNYVSLTDLYNGANVTASGSNQTHNYAGGILGRIAKSNIKEVSSCINTGNILFDGSEAYGISAVELDNTNLYNNFTNCYTLKNTGLPDGGSEVTENALLSGTLLTGLSNSWSAVNGLYQVPSMCITSSASGYLYIAGIKLEFNGEDTADNVNSDITLPAKAGNEILSWSTDDSLTLKINNYIASPQINSIINDTFVTLTAKSSSGFSKSFKLKIISHNKMSAAFEQDYASVGSPLTVKIENTRELTFNYTWTVNDKTITNNTPTYIPTANDIESFIKVSITSTDNAVHLELITYLSELPVVYVDTSDGTPITSTTTSKDANIKVQGNDEYNDATTFYNGDAAIKGRGNSTWSMADNLGVKKPYKIKLSSKSNLLGMGQGKNKHWVLLANMIDHTGIRNELTYNLAKDIGLEHSPATANVVLILNGEYSGMYELCEHIRIGKSRVNVFDWEELADNIADAIAKAENLDSEALETAMEQNFLWRTSGYVSFKNKNYKLSDYYDTSQIPDFTGGFLMDMDFRTGNTSKYISSFKTTMHGNDGIPMFFRSPEYAKTDSEMMNYTKNFLDTYENALNSEDYYTNDLNTKEAVHYTDLFDLDSLVKYWFICEFTMNWDSMKNSTYLYKDITGKAKMGPVWDYDWAFGNINMYSGTAPFVITGWHSTCDSFCEQQYQHYQWNRYLVKDPYFALKAYETYKNFRSTLIENIIKKNGILDTSEKKYQNASTANDAKWGFSYNSYSGNAIDSSGKTFYTKSQSYNDAFTTLKQYINKRVAWLDNQFKLSSTDINSAVRNLYTSFGNQTSDKITINSVDTTKKNTTTINASVTDTKAAELSFQINGTHMFTSKVNDSSANITIGDECLNTGINANNVVEVHVVNSDGYYIGKENNFAVFSKTVVIENTPEPTAKPTSTVRPTVTSTPTAAPTVKPIKTNAPATKIPASTAPATQSPNNTTIQTAAPTAAPTPSNMSSTPENITSTVIPEATFPAKSTVKASLQVTGKNRVKAGKSIILHAKTKGLTGRKIKWSLNSKGKMLFRLNKKTGKTIRLYVRKNKTGKGVIIVKCGSLITKKNIKIIVKSN